MSKESAPQPDGVSYGANASDNIAITGGVVGDVVLGGKHIYEAPSQVINALHQLPASPRDFTGREAEIVELMSALEDGGFTLFGLRGMGGVGKTALALKLAERLKNRYPDAQIYIDLRGASAQPLMPSEALAHVIHAYHPTAKLPENGDELRGLYLSVLHNQSTLLLMDNARDGHQVEPLIPPESCMLLVTSRNYLTLPGLRSSILDTMPIGDASDLLLKITPRIGDLAGEIAKLCGCLPLALRLAAGALSKHANIKPADYSRKLVDAREQLKLIDASLTLSYDLLSKELQEQWRALAVFPNTFDEVAAAVVWGTKPDLAQETLGELLAFSLVEWNEEVARYRLHDLARVFADAKQVEAEREVCRQRHSTHYQKVLSASEYLFLKGGEEVAHGLALLDTEWVNISAGQSWAARASGGVNEAAARLCIAYPYAGANVLNLRQRPRERLQWLEAMLAEARRLKQRDAEGRALGELGLAYATLGNTKRAIESYEQQFAIAREIGDRSGEGNSLGNLGYYYYYLGEARRSIEFYEQQLAIAREIGDRRSEGNALGNLGIACKNLGDIRRAIEFYKQQLAIAREIGDRSGEGNALGNLGYVHAALGEIRHAIEFYEQALAIAREISDRRGEGRHTGNLGSAYAKSGDARRAIALCEQQLAIAREIGNRRGEGSALGNLGDAYAALGETGRAIEFYEQALVIFREIGNRRGEGNALWNTALELNKLGDRAQAIAGAEAALKIYEQIEDPNAAKVRKQLKAWGGKGAAKNERQNLIGKIRRYFFRR